MSSFRSLVYALLHANATGRAAALAASSKWGYRKVACPDYTNFRLTDHPRLPRSSGPLNQTY